MMKPILFNTDMVRALLEERKTVTRDILQDLRDVEEGIEVVHASDQQRAAEAKKREARKKRREEKELRLKRQIHGKAAQPNNSEEEQLSLFG